jgi:hypothetical protein
MRSKVSAIALRSIKDLLPTLCLRHPISNGRPQIKIKCSEIMPLALKISQLLAAAAQMDNRRIPFVAFRIPPGR